ncbi:MAG: ribonuclease J [Ruminococcaceae bacterium]|nr:ribonuclease J [Oscillospiraceae bacterium]
MPKKQKKVKPTGKVRIIPLGGLGEVGKNMTAIEYENEMIVIDCGIGFPDEDMPGIDLVIPDFAYLEANSDKLQGVLLTHGHEDHIGAIPYLLRTVNPPIFGTPLTLGIIRNKLQEHLLPWNPDLRTVNAGDRIKLGSFEVEFIHVNHSIADACALAIRTPLGTIVHTGDFKLDTSPIDGEMMDIVRLGEIGREGVMMLLCESTNAERPGHTPSEKKVGASLEYIFSTHEKKRIIIATFSSNVHRVQQIIDTSIRHKRKVAITGRSMLNIVSAATELGYMKIPSGVLVDLNDIRRYKPGELTLITTGSQGEPMSALYRMAFSDHSQVMLDANDLVVLSASAIPGNEKLVGRIINELSKNEVEVLHDAVVEVHVSGHACQEELKLMQALIKPKYFMPIHGESRHLAANRELAKYMGMKEKNIFLSEIGKVLEIDTAGARFIGTVPAGKVLIDGYGIGDVGNIVLRDRRHLAQDGLIVVVATVDLHEKLLLSGPDIVSRGFVYVREAEELMEEARQIAYDALMDVLESRGPADRMQIKKQVKDDLTKYLYAKTKRKPMILPVIMDI